MEFSRLLSDEHKPIRRALHVLKVMTEQVEQGVWTDRHDVNALLIFLHYFVDVCHQAKEESILFPALKSSQKYYGSRAQLEGLLEEHNEERGLLEKTQLLLLTNKKPEFIVSARKLISLLSDHATKEEDILFPLAEQILPTEKAQEIAVQMMEADARFGYTQVKLLVDMLQTLHEKYIRKVA
jgi:hemerythrin-like domain-containing protein